jgi:signal transduction histidine kinase
MSRKHLPTYRLLVLTILLTTLVFCGDVLAPLGLASGVPYIFVILLSLGSRNRSFILGMAVVVSLLTVWGHFITKPPSSEVHVRWDIGADAWVDIVNRMLALAVIWVTTLLSLARQYAEEERARLTRRVAARERLAILGEMSAGVAHEFRNPLHGVLNCMEMLRKRIGTDPADVELLDLADEGLRRMDDISGRMLSMGREDTGLKAPTIVAQVVQNAVSMVRFRAQKENIQLDVNVDTGLPQVVMDAARISEAVLNLLTNALDACVSGGRVELRAQRHAEQNNAVLIEVLDNGSGIPLDVRKRIFEPFFTTKPVGKGAGLGLTIVRAVVENHGGTVVISPRPEGGTRAALILPIQRAEGS